MKSFTDLEQSKKLTKILPLESADAHWCLRRFAPKADIEEYDEFPVFGYSKEYLPCWSLAALMRILPKESRLLKSAIDDNTYHCDCPNFGNNRWLDNPVDACVEMIFELHKLNLL